jgi:hypothetical protein
MDFIALGESCVLGETAGRSVPSQSWASAGLNGFKPRVGVPRGGAARVAIAGLSGASKSVGMSGMHAVSAPMLVAVKKSFSMSLQHGFAATDVSAKAGTSEDGTDTRMRDHARTVT